MTGAPDEPGFGFADDAHRYRLDSRIATGGMGEVWRATDTVLGRQVAVKLLKHEYADDPSFRSRFETEARHAASLHHPNVAAVYDFGESAPADGSGVHRPYLVMELVDGQPLSALLLGGRQLDPAATRDLLAQAADALGAAHAAGIVHRDVKPANLIVTPSRQVKITDFGIARAAEAVGLTQTGQVMGTPQYLSPEQARGETATPASDVYSLGVVAFECLAGRRPFVADTAIATALAHLREPVPELPGDVPADLAAVVRRAMAKSPDDRYPDAAGLAAALRDPATAATEIQGMPPATDEPTQVLAGVGAATATPTGPASGPPTSPTGDRSRAVGDRRRRAFPWLLVLVAVLLAAVVVIALVADGGDEPGATPGQTRGSTSSEPAGETSEPSEPTTDATPDNTVVIDEDDYVGRDVKEVEKELRDLGLKVDKSELENLGTEEENAVDSVDPDGTLQEGDTVTVSYWGKAPKVTGPPSDSPSTSPTESPSESASGAASQSPAVESPAVETPEASSAATSSSANGKGKGRSR